MVCVELQNLLGISWYHFVAPNVTEMPVEWWQAGTNLGIDPPVQSFKRRRGGIQVETNQATSHLIFVVFQSAPHMKRKTIW